MFIVAVVIVGLLKALSVGTSGTMDINLRTSALNLARTQLEYVKAQSYNASAGNLSKIYGVINASNMSNTKNFSITGDVRWVNTSCTSNCLQQITVNVSYASGTKKVQVIGYKNPDQTSTVTYTYNTSAAWAWERRFTNTEYYINNYPANPADFFLNSGYSTYTFYPATPADLTNVTHRDSLEWQTQRTNTANEVNAQLYKIKIAQDRRDITNISVTWVGHGGPNCNCNLFCCYPTEVKVYKASATNGSGWISVGSGNTVKTTVTWTQNLTYPWDYIDPSGNISILAAAAACADIINSKNGIYTNYISLNVTVAPVPIARALQDGGINPLPYLAEAPVNNPLLARNTGITYQYNVSLAGLSVERQ
jgi:hypothetical protein